MKKFIIILFFCLNMISFAHEQHVHQYLTREAYLLLQSIYGDIPVMVDHVGTTQQGSGPWTSPYIVTGAYREDEEDVVYHRDGLFGIYSSATHFWIADDGENSEVTLRWTFNQITDQETFPSAYTKICKYANGDWEVQGSTDWLFLVDGKRARLVDQTGSSCRKFYYDGLVNLYINGSVQIKDLSYEYYILDVESGDDFLVAPTNHIITLTLNNDTKSNVVWEILGRMCHL